MHDPIVPESDLRAVHAEIVSLLTHQQGDTIDTDNPNYGSAFVYFLFFTQHPSVASLLSVSLSDEDKFYNAYFWFQRFVTFYIGQHGYDAGLEQQAFMMLEHAGFALDLEIIEALDRRASE